MLPFSLRCLTDPFLLSVESGWKGPFRVFLPRPGLEWCAGKKGRMAASASVKTWYSETQKAKQERPLRVFNVLKTPFASKKTYCLS